LAGGRLRRTFSSSETSDIGDIKPHKVWYVNHKRLVREPTIGSQWTSASSPRVLCCNKT
jgi:hypothetical protein